MFRFVPVALFAASVMLVFAAPWALDASYPPMSASISESAGQLVDGSWLARFALAFSGLGVLATVHLRHRAWHSLTTFAYVAFGVFWILTAANAVPRDFNDFEVAARESGPAFDKGKLWGFIRHARISEAQVSAFWERMAELVTEFDRLPRTGRTVYGFAIGVYPTDHPVLPTAEDG